MNYKKLVMASVLSLGLFSFALAQTDYEALGEKFMDLMSQKMGVSHESMDKFMEERMGPVGLKQMHEMMGRMSLSKTADYDYINAMVPIMQTMMGFYPDNYNAYGPEQNPMSRMMGLKNYGGSYGMMGNWSWGWMGFFGLLSTVFFTALTVFLILGCVRLWQTINKKN